MWELDDVEAFAKSLHPAVTADLFAEDWVSFRIAGKWFLVFDLTVVEPRIAVKLDPEYALDLRDRHPGIRPAWHMNKRHWSNVYQKSSPLIPLALAMGIQRRFFLLLN